MHATSSDFCETEKYFFSQLHKLGLQHGGLDQNHQI